jgi:hypothetical protein
MDGVTHILVEKSAIEQLERKIDKLMRTVSTGEGKAPSVFLRKPDICKRMQISANNYEYLRRRPANPLPVVKVPRMGAGMWSEKLEEWIEQEKEREEQV